MAGNVCDTCRRQGNTHVGSSTFAAISWAWCQECLDENAEPEASFLYLYETNPDIEAWHESVRSYKTWKDGKYITFEDWWSWKKSQLPGA